MRARAVTILGSCALFWSTAARADFALEWSAPKGCPGRAVVLARMTRLLGKPPDSTREPALWVRAEVTELPSQAHDRFRVRLLSQTAEGPSERSVDGVSCERVTDAAVLILAMAIDAEAVAARLNSPPPPPPAPPPPRREPTPAPEPAPPRIALWTRAGALADAGALPRINPGFAVGIGVSVGRVWLEAQGTKWLAQRIESPDRPGAGGRFERRAFALRTCFEVSAGWFSAGPCAGTTLGWMSGEGYGISDPEDGGSAWVEAFAGGALRLRLSELFALRADLDAVTPLVNPRFSIGGVGSVHRAPFVFGRGALALELHFR
jgi:hypothetical protein